jgi:hypothetical protein
MICVRVNWTLKQYLEKDGLLYHQQVSGKSKVLRYFVPRQNRLGLLRLFYDEQCHVGADKTIASINKHFWFPHLRQFVHKYVKHCLACAVKKTRTGPLQGFIRSPEKPTVPLHVVHIDCLGPLSVSSQKYKYVLVVVDAFTKYCHLIPLKSVTAYETQQALQTLSPLVFRSTYLFRNRWLPTKFPLLLVRRRARARLLREHFDLIRRIFTHVFFSSESTVPRAFADRFVRVKSIYYLVPGIFLFVETLWMVCCIVSVWKV